MDMQNLIVDFIVGLAIGYAIWRFMPANGRRAVARMLARISRMLGISEVQAQQIERKLESNGGCGSCDSCKACATPAEKSGHPLQFRK
jgi:hypothetical protein